MKTPLLTVRDYMRIGFRRKKALLMPIILSALLVIPLMQLMPAKYRAAATVKRNDMAFLSSAPGIGHAAPTVSVRTLTAEILTPRRLDYVIHELKMDVDIKSEAQKQATYRRLIKTIVIRSIARGTGEDVVEISAISRDPGEAQRLANAIADTYMDTSNRASAEETISAVEFYRKSTEETQRRLQQVEATLDEFSRKHYAQLPEVKSNLNSRLFALQTEETSTMLVLTDAQNRLKEIESQIEKTELTIRTETQTEENPGALELQNQLVIKRRLLVAMLAELTEEHPQVTKLRVEIGTIEDQLREMPNRVPGVEREIINPLYQQLMQDRLTVQQEITGKEAALHELRANISALTKEAQGMANQEKSYNELLRQQSEYSRLYDQYKNNLTLAQNRLALETTERGIRVEKISDAFKPTDPYNAFKWQLGFAVIAAGAGLGVCLMFMLEFSDHSFRSADDASSYLGMPVLSSLSMIDEERQASRERLGTVVVIVVAAIIVALMSGSLMYMKINYPLFYGQLQSYL